ncbi:hypothetical protein [Roseiflexus castenholzii]|uniref:Uncharacterized protein n=1 Tax=Roseiflexus castenholzii (strain DSM 13941 / HLO8) TaxID=383372 RepID=A7NH29_ROSCS|nr:hypothetical protein [Roseiflexus castenholzii]ABU56776.1 hypothetical protein Rcas_0651 [Roseiflexus castenholzii DSM 13941]
MRGRKSVCAVWRHLIVSVTPGSRPIRIDARATLLLEEEPRVRLAALSLSHKVAQRLCGGVEHACIAGAPFIVKEAFIPQAVDHSAIKARSIPRQSFLGTAGTGTSSLIAGTQPTAQPDGSVSG